MSGRPGFQQSVVVATIPDDQSLSAGVKLGNLAPVALVIPSANWVAADITFQASFDGGTTWLNLFDSGSDTEITVQAAASRFIGLLAAVADPLSGIQWLKVRSGTSGAAVNQTTGPQLVNIVCVS